MEVSKILYCEIDNLFSFFQTPIKGPTKPYDTINYDPGMINDYGGYPPDRNWRGPSGGGGGGRGGRGGGGGHGGGPGG